MRKIDIRPIGSVNIRKSSRAKRIILKFNHLNEPTVVIPKYAPYALGITFAKQNTSWILIHQKQVPEIQITNGMLVGKQHQFKFKSSKQDDVKGRIQNNTIFITYPEYLTSNDPRVQKIAANAAVRAIKREAEVLLPRHLHELAQKFNYEYKSVSVKNMRTRWGSCSSLKVINLNIWLIQLSNDLIEYVCCHELAHLRHLHHKTAFWAELGRMVPDYKLRRKLLKEKAPGLTIT